MKHFTIPVFVPELACPNRCVFCNQNSISGCYNQPDATEVKTIIKTRLATIPDGSYIEVGFFGGNFTGIDEALQREYLSIASTLFKQGAINGIRISTRPDYINLHSLKLLREYNVTTIELGAQSLDEKVLTLAGRGHTVADIEQAAALIKQQGFSLGLQMMTGLPGDTPLKSIQTAKKIVSLGANCTRIYPTLVIKGTELEQLWLNGLYKPQPLDEAVSLTATLLEIFRDSGVDVIRVGLHPSEDLIKGTDLLAGPFHVSMRQLAESELWKQRFKLMIEEQTQHTLVESQDNKNFLVHHYDFIGSQTTQVTESRNDQVTHSQTSQTANNRSPKIIIKVPEKELNVAIGYKGSNRIMLEEYFKQVEFITDLTNIEKPFIIADRRIPLPAKNALTQLGKLAPLENHQSVYKTISGHPDIFFCIGSEAVVIAPDISIELIDEITSRGYHVVNGYSSPGREYPSSAIYNAVVTDEYIIHNLKITEPAILETFKNRKCLHVNQGYTRCNLLALNNNSFITSDRGIEKVLINEGKEVLYVDPTPVILKGQKHGFFPGCCGVFNNSVIINGSLKHHPQQEQITAFIKSQGLMIKELFDGKLSDVGSILIVKQRDV